MQFDKIAGCLEKYDRMSAKLFQESKLFICPQKEVDLARIRIKEFCEETKSVEDMALRLRLPFQTCAIEIPEYNYVTVFFEYGEKEKANLIKAIAKYWGREAQVFYGFIYGCYANKKDWVVCIGALLIEKAEPGTYDGGATAFVTRSLGIDPINGFSNLDLTGNDKLSKYHNEEFAPLAVQAMTGVFHLNASGDFVVEKTPRRDNKKRRKKLKRNLVNRTDDRPHYIFVKPNQALEFFNPGGWGHKKKPHARRGHLRRYQDGKTVWVRATWLGLQKRTDRDARYKIMLDV